MSTDEYQLLTTVKTLDEAVEITKQHGLSKYRTSNLAHSTKYSYKCSEYRKYPFCRYEIQVYIHDNDPTTIKLTYKNAHYHDQRNVTTRLPSPVRDSVKKYVKCHLTQSQIINALSMDYPNESLPTNQLSNLINYIRRQNNPEIFSVYDFNQWCMNYKYDDTSLHSTFVSYYSINNNATYKLTWNNLPLLVFGSSDADRHFRPFDVALVSSDEHASCFEELFVQLQRLSEQKCNRPYIVNYIMSDGAPGMTKAQEKIFPHAKRLMCWAHDIRRCREHRKLVPKDKWNQVDNDIHNLHLCVSDIIFNHGSSLLKLKWDKDPMLHQFQTYFFEQWITKLPLWYEGAAYHIPSTNNGCESLNGKIKQQYTLRNKLHLSAFFPKVEQMLHDWSTTSYLKGFLTKPSISTDLELASMKWSNSINQIDILYWFDTWYIVPSSNSYITPAVWLQIYQLQQWTSFDEFIIWLKSCYLVSPLSSCTCSSGMKLYVCKHSVGLGMLLKLYEIKDKTRSELLGKRRGKGRSKKVKSALQF